MMSIETYRAGRRTRRGGGSWFNGVALALLAAGPWLAPALTAAAEVGAGVPLRVRQIEGAVEVSWTARSVTAQVPYLHYEYQVQVSSNLVDWQDFGPLKPGGVRPELEVVERIEIPVGHPQSFARLVYRLNLPGSNLAGSDLDGAALGGADLSGADLRGATFDGANIEGAVLDGAQLAGVSFRHATGTPILSALGGAGTGSASLALPRLRYHPRSEDYPRGAGASPVSPVIVVGNLRQETTVAQFNGVLAASGARVVGCLPGQPQDPSGIVTLRLPAGGAGSGPDAALANLAATGAFAVVAPDYRLAEAALPREPETALLESDWEWSLPAAGGNWGMELMGMPQVWNFNDAVRKRSGNGGPTVLVGVIEGGIVGGHPDLAFFAPVVGPANASDAAIGHGAHVSGIIGALHGNGLGVQGVSPFVELRVEVPTNGVPTDQWQRDAVENLASLGVQVINISLAIPWGQGTNNPNNDTIQQQNLNASGDLSAKTLRLLGGAVPFLCVAAGNDSDSPTLGRADIDAIWANSWGNAALRGLTGNDVIIVEAAGADSFGAVGPADLRRSAFSNVNGHLSAPGENILSAYYPPLYTAIAGTSMATPHITGLAAHLLALDPGLTHLQLASLLLDQTLPVNLGGSGFVQAWPAAMGIDEIRGDKTLLALLLDIDDGTEDGNLRVLGTGPDPLRYRVYEPVLSPPLGLGREFYLEDLDGDGGPGDGRIDMSDFRRWRDWLLAGSATPPALGAGLNGREDHPKRDANGDGRVSADELEVYPRGDFNGDGRMDRNLRVTVPGALRSAGALSDLEVLTRSGLWADGLYSAHDAEQLMDSADWWVSASSFFQREPAIGPVSGVVSLRDAASGAPLGFGGAVQLSAGKPLQVFTVPVGRRAFVASDPIALADGTNVMMRSVGDLQVPSGLAGADYDVDLALVEMTAVVDVAELDLREIQSEPDATEVSAYIPAENGIETYYGHEYAGAEAWANDAGTFYALARTGLVPEVPWLFAETNTFQAGVRWQRSFVKVANEPDPVFEIKPMQLLLLGGGPLGEDLVAAAEIRVEVRRAGAADWETNFFMAAEIAGAGDGSGLGTYRKVREEGDLPAKDLEFMGNPAGGVRYTQDSYQGTIDLAGLSVGESFDVRYTLHARAVGFGVDHYAASWVADPLNYGNGLQMEYAGFGELPRVLNSQPTGEGGFLLTHRSRTNFYYILLRREPGTGVWTPVDLALGLAGQGELVDPNPPANASAADYVIQNRRLDRPMDHDQDGIDDVYELRHPDLLNPLDAADALGDGDGDGRSQWREYLDGTDPSVADPARAPVSRLYPARLFALGSSGGVVPADLNNDGLVDFVSIADDGAGVQAVLGEGGEHFLPPIVSGVTNNGYLGEVYAARFDGDTWMDLALLDRTRAMLHVLRGLGNGRFESMGVYPTANFPERIVPGDFNRDNIPDLLVLSGSARVLTVWQGVGDGSFVSRPQVAISMRPAEAVLARIDGDLHPDLAVTLSSSEVAVLPGNGDGTFGAERRVPVGFGPGPIVVGQFNADGHADLIVGNRSTDDLSVLLGNGDLTFASEVRVPAGNSPSVIRVTELNGDGHQDVVVAHLGDVHHLVLLGNGAGGFPVTRKVFSAETESFHLIDVSGDGRLDLVTGAGLEQLILSGDGAGGFETRDQVAVPGLRPVGLELVDVTGDGRVDAVVANARSNTVEVLAGQPDGRFGAAVRIPVAGAVVGLASGQFDSGGTRDLAIITQRPDFQPGTSSNALQILLGQGNGTFQVRPVVLLPTAPDLVLGGDLNGDGRDDLVALSSGVGQVRPFLSDGTGGFTPGPVLELGGAVYRHELRDLNGDGRADWVASVLTDSTNAVQVFHANAVGLLELVQEWNLAAGAYVDGFGWFDGNGDGREDLVIGQGGADGSQLVPAWLGADGRFTVAPPLVVEDLTVGWGFTFADLTGDGRPDLTAGAYVWPGLVSGGFGAPERHWLGGSLPVQVRDLNGDGRPDLIAADDDSDSVQVLLHR